MIAGASLFDEMFPPSLFSGLDVLMAEGAPVGLCQGFSGDAVFHLCMLGVLVGWDGFFALWASFIVLMVLALC